MELKALIFDVDGTLADTEEAHRQAFNRAFQKAGLDWHWSTELYGQLLAVTGGKERIRYFVKYYTEQPPLKPDFIASLHADKTDFYKQMMADPGLPLRPGVERLIKEARQAGLRLAIATTTTPANVTALLKGVSSDALNWFELIAAGDVVPAKKPAPDIYLWAMKKMGLSPEQCLAIEDSDNGLRSALAAGIRTVLITLNHYTRQHRFDGASAVLEHLGDPDQPIQSDHPIPLSGWVDLSYLKRLHHG